MENKKKEPLFHITKRSVTALPKYQAMLIRIASIIIALLLCGIITTIVTKLNPIDVYATIFNGAFGTERKMWITFRNLAILLMISLALTPAFKMKFWNIGGEGQVLMGCLASAACMVTLNGKVSNGVMILIMIISSIISGAAWALIPALFKAKWNTNETLATLMMNYIATQLVAFFVIRWESPKGSGKMGMINQKSQLGWLPNIGDNQYILTIIIALALVVIMYIYLNYSKHGYEISVVGESINTARYVGISVKKVIIRTMILSGSICGLTGLLLVGGINHTLSTTLVNGQGFTAVLVSWMAKFNPITMIASSFVIAFMDRGAGDISTQFGLNQSYADILTGIILFFIIGCEFFIDYKITFRKMKKEGK